MAAYPAFFALYPTIERMRNIRGLEYSNGVRSLPLWLAYMTFDFIPVLLSSAIGVAVFAAVSNVWYHVGYLFIIFVLYGLASILLAYVVSLFAKTQLSAYALVATGQAVMFLVYMIAYLCTLTYTVSRPAFFTQSCTRLTEPGREQDRLYPIGSAFRNRRFLTYG